jgi:hypothetical protein
MKNPGNGSMLLLIAFMLIAVFATNIAFANVALNDHHKPIYIEASQDVIIEKSDREFVAASLSKKAKPKYKKRKRRFGRCVYRSKSTL